MYFLLIEIGCLKYLKIFYERLMTEALRKLNDALREMGCDRPHYKDNYILFRFTRDEELPYRETLQAASRAARLLEAVVAIFGYNMLIEAASDSNPEEVRELLADKLRASCANNALLIGPNAYDSFASFIVANRIDDLWEVKQLREEKIAAIEDISHFALHDDTAKRIDDALATIESRQEPGTIELIGNRYCGNIHNIAHALRARWGRKIAWLHLIASEHRDDPLVIFARSIKLSRLEQESQFFDENERTLWKKRLALLRMAVDTPGRRGLYGNFDEEFRQGYRLYLLSLFRQAISMGGLPIIVIEDAHYIQSRTGKLFAKIVQSLPVDLGIVTIISATTAIPTKSLGLQGEPQIIRASRYSDSDYRAKAALLLGKDIGTRDELSAMGTEQERSLPIQTYFLLKNIQRNGSPQPDSFIDAINNLSEIDRQLLLIISILRGNISNAKFSQMIETLGYQHHHIELSKRRMTRIGLLRNYEVPVHFLPDSFWENSKYHTEYIKLRSMVAHTLYAMWKKKMLPLSDYWVKIAEQYIAPRDALELWAASLEELQLRGSIEESRIRLYGEHSALRLLTDPVDIDHWQTILFIYRVRLALATNDLESCKQFERQSRTAMANILYGGLARQAWARRSAAMGNIDGSIELIKQAIARLQQDADEENLYSAYADYALFLLFAGKIKDAERYCDLVARDDIATNNSPARIRSATVGAVISFLQGNLSKTLDCCSKIISALETIGWSDYRYFVLFLRARTYFELGYYDEASSKLTLLLYEGHRAKKSEAAAAIHNWLARITLYRGNAENAVATLESLAPSLEQRFFLAESYERLGKNEKALEMLNDALQQPVRQSASFIERIDWSNGFSSIEDVIIGNRNQLSVLRKGAMAMRGLIIARSHTIDRSKEEMYRLTRSDALSNLDPTMWFYLYCYYEILTLQRDREDEHFQNILGRAVIHLNMRLHAIEHKQHKKQYHSRNYWRQLLWQKAKRHNLM